MTIRDIKESPVYDKGLEAEGGYVDSSSIHPHGDAEGTYRVETHRGISSRQAQMIAIGGTIGTGLFVGTGQALAVAGPGFVFLAYGLICLFVYGIVTATIEVSSYLPVTGSSMSYYGTRFVSKSFGFAMGWLYFYSWGIIVAYEITAAGIVINYWEGARHIPIAVWISIMLVLIIGLNFFPVKIYGEAEFWFASLKVFMVIGLLILSFVLFWGGGPNHDRLGFRYWVHPGATKEYLVDGAAGRFCAFLYVLIFSTFAFEFGPELIVITGGEMESPRTNLPRASRHYFWRLMAFYFLGSLAIGVICDSNSPALTNGGVGAAASPWVIAIKEAGIGGLDSVVNAIVITSAWSSGNSYLYMTSRSLYSLAVAGNAPRIFSRCNRWGVPYVAVFTSSLFGLLAYLNVGSSSGVVFNWFINLTNTAGFISWVCCCIIYLRFRKACDVQGVTVPYRSFIQPYAAWVCLVFFSLLCLLNGFYVFFPGQFTASSFLTAYIGLPIFLVIYAAHRVVNWSDSWAYAPEDVDMKSGLDEVLAMERTEDEAELKRGFWYRFKAAFWE